jgi:hypothetical protein
MLREKGAQRALVLMSCVYESVATCPVGLTEEMQVAIDRRPLVGRCGADLFDTVGVVFVLFEHIEQVHCHTQGGGEGGDDGGGGQRVWRGGDGGGDGGIAGRGLSCVRRLVHGVMTGQAWLCALLPESALIPPYVIMLASDFRAAFDSSVDLRRVSSFFLSCSSVAIFLNDSVLSSPLAFSTEFGSSGASKP